MNGACHSAGRKAAFVRGLPGVALGSALIALWATFSTGIARPAQAPKAAPAPPPVEFIDITATSGIRFRNQTSKTSRKYLIESMVGGVAALDYDRDGRQDLYFVNGAALKDPMPPGEEPDKSDPKYWDRLYRNRGDGTFEDVTEKAGVRGRYYGMGAVAADYNNDGFPDIYVTNYGRNILYRNEGDGTFADVTREAGVEGGGWSAGATFVDYDKDGDLDLFVSRYLQWDFSMDIWCGPVKPGYRAYCHPDKFDPISHILYRNNGDGTFADVSKAAGIAAHPGKGLGVAIQDHNADGWPDIAVANDAFAQQLFRNNRDGTFTEEGLLTGMAYDADGQAFSGMGIDFADYDEDGWPDIFVNALANQRYALFRNDKGNFDYVSADTGVARSTMLHSGWGTRFLDYDNDGDKDLFVAQGHVMDNIELTQPSVRYLEPPLLLRNAGGKFEDVSASAGAAFQRPLAARGVAFADLDNDGWVDLAINCSDGPAVILRNRGGNNNWLVVETVGSAGNRDGIGASIRLVTPSGRVQHAMVTTSGSYVSGSDKRVFFGLGRDVAAQLLEIRWPSGKLLRRENVKANQFLVVREAEAE